MPGNHFGEFMLSIPVIPTHVLDKRRERATLRAALGLSLSNAVIASQEETKDTPRERRLGAYSSGCDSKVSSEPGWMKDVRIRTTLEVQRIFARMEEKKERREFNARILSMFPKPSDED